jgi:hypothetical protein
MSRTSQHFMEPEGSSPCSQEPFTGSCPEPDQSSLHPEYSADIWCGNIQVNCLYTWQRLQYLHDL